MRLAVLFLIFPLLATAQLKEFEVSEMERPDVAVLQANAQWLDDALLLVYSSLKNLNFRSSLGAIDKVSYNTQSNRYEVFFKPNKQILFVYASNFVEQKIETFNPNPKDVFYYKVEEKQEEVISTEPGTLKIITEPSGADVFVNGLQQVLKTPFEGNLNPGTTRIKLQKAKHETIDTTVAVRSGEPTVLNILMTSTTREPSALPTEIGQAYGGGIVFDISEDGHGLIVALEDIGDFNWKEAKSECLAYKGGGYTDWYLPSKEELKKLYEVKEGVNRSLLKGGSTAISRTAYWSSTEYNASFAWKFHFYSGYASSTNKGSTGYVRAVRVLSH